MTPICALCDNPTQRISAPPVSIGAPFFESQNLGLAACGYCGVRFVFPRPNDESLTAFYNADGYDCHNPTFGSVGQVRLDIVERFTKKGPLCDFGAGAGRLMLTALSNGWEVCGVEAGGIARASLQRQGLHVASNLPELGLQPNVMTMVHVLEHMTSPGQTLTEIYNTLPAGGILYVEVPNADSLRARLANSPLKPFWTHAPERFLAFPIHLFYFNPRSLRSLLQKVGFSVREMGTMGLGVEELFQPSRPQVTSDSSGSMTPARSLRFQSARNFIKQVFSRFRLGENLYLVAQK
jgi:Methyltransferase domain